MVILQSTSSDLEAFERAKEKLIAFYNNVAGKRMAYRISERLSLLVLVVDTDIQPPALITYGESKEYEYIKIKDPDSQSDVKELYIAHEIMHMLIGTDKAGYFVDINYAIIYEIHEHLIDTQLRLLYPVDVWKKTDKPSGVRKSLEHIQDILDAFVKQHEIDTQTVDLESLADRFLVENEKVILERFDLK